MSQLDLFAEPPADSRQQRREQRRQQAAHRQAVAAWAEDVLLRELALRLEVPDGAKLPTSDLELVRVAVRIGRLPGSIWETRA
jgi:hypothetical protein